MGEAAAPGDLRRRRHPQGARRGGAAGAGGAHGLPGRHHADGARRVPRRPPAVPRHAGHARQLHRGHVDAEGRPAHRARARASTTGSRARSSAFAPDAKIIHVDIDPAELGKVRRADVPIVGDCRLVIEELVKAVKADHNKREWPVARRVARSSCASGRSATRSGTSSRRTARSSRSSASTCCATTRPTTRSSCRASASTRCGPASAGSSTTRTRSSTRAGSARWASRCRRRSAPRSASPSAWCGRSTATAASR